MLDTGNNILTAGGQPSFDQTKPWGPGQQAPLTPEYQKVLEDSTLDAVCAQIDLEIHTALESLERTREHRKEVIDP